MYTKKCNLESLCRPFCVERDANQIRLTYPYFCERSLNEKPRISQECFFVLRSAKDTPKHMYGSDKISFFTKQKKTNVKQLLAHLFLGQFSMPR